MQLHLEARDSLQQTGLVMIRTLYAIPVSIGGCLVHKQGHEL